MASFTSSRAELFTAKGISKPTPCAMKFVDESIEVMFMMGRQNTSFRGHEVAPGHFRLKAVTDHGEATLHRFEEADSLEGSWSHGSSGGMLKIKLIAG